MQLFSLKKHKRILNRFLVFFMISAKKRRKLTAAVFYFFFYSLTYGSRATNLALLIAVVSFL